MLFYHQENEKKPDDQKTNINVVQDIYKYIKDREKEDYLKISICDEHNVIFNGIIRKLRTINKIDVLDVAHMSKKIIKTRNRRNGNKLLLYRNNKYCYPHFYLAFNIIFYIKTYIIFYTLN